MFASRTLDDCKPLHLAIDPAHTNDTGSSPSSWGTRFRSSRWPADVHDEDIDPPAPRFGQAFDQHPPEITWRCGRFLTFRMRRQSLVRDLSEPEHDICAAAFCLPVDSVFCVELIAHSIPDFGIAIAP